MAEAKDPLRQLFDVAVYAPIGLITLAQRELPRLVATGKSRLDNQVTIARFVGRMALRHGKKELDRRLADADKVGASDAVYSSLSLDAADDGPVGDSLPEIIIDAVAHSPVLTEGESLPIEGYDSLAASQVVLRLGSLTQTELGAVYAYESANRARRTILGKVAQLRAK